MGVSTLHASNIKGFAFEFVQVSPVWIGLNMYIKLIISCCNALFTRCAKTLQGLFPLFRQNFLQHANLSKLTDRTALGKSDEMYIKLVFPAEI